MGPSAPFSTVTWPASRSRGAGISRQTAAATSSASPCLPQTSIPGGTPSTHDEDQSLPMVRQPGRRSGQVLRWHLQEVQDPEDQPLRRGRLRDPQASRRLGDDRGIRARGPELHRAEWRADLQVHRSSVAADLLQNAEGSRLLLGQAHGGWRPERPAMRLAQGQVRPFLAGRAERRKQAAERPEVEEIAARVRRDDADEKARSRGAQARLRREMTREMTYFFFSGTIWKKTSSPRMRPSS